MHIDCCSSNGIYSAYAVRVFSLVTVVMYMCLCIITMCMFVWAPTSATEQSNWLIDMQIVLGKSVPSLMPQWFSNFFYYFFFVSVCLCSVQRAPCTIVHCSSCSRDMCTAATLHVTVRPSNTVQLRINFRNKIIVFCACFFLCSSSCFGCSCGGRPLPMPSCCCC